MKNETMLALYGIKQNFPAMQTLYLLSDSHRSEIRAIIEPKARRRKVSLQVLLSGIIYLLQNGCKWESLPPVYGHCKLAWYYYNKLMFFGVPGTGTV